MVIEKYHQTDDIHISLNQPILQSVENTISLSKLLSDLPTKHCKTSGKVLTPLSDCSNDSGSENSRNTPVNPTKRPLTSHIAVSTKRCRVSDSLSKSSSQILRKTKNKKTRNCRKKVNAKSNRKSGRIETYLMKV